jgi:hypothetical protein
MKIIAALLTLFFAFASSFPCVKLYSVNDIMGPGCQTASGEISTEADYQVVCAPQCSSSLNNYLSIIRFYCKGEGYSVAKEIVEECNAIHH